MGMPPEQRNAAALGLLQSLMLAPDARYARLLLSLASEPNESVVEGAVVAMSRVRDRRFIPVLVARLATRRGRSAAREAIVSQGAEALAELRRLLLDDSTPPAVRRHIPGTLARFGSQAATDLLCSQLGQESWGLVRYKILKAVEVIALHHPVVVRRQLMEDQLRLNLVEHLRMATYAHGFEMRAPAEPSESASRRLLVELLNEKADQALDRGFRLLQVLHRNEDIASVAQATRSSDKKARANAREFLDALMLDASVGDVRQLLSVLVDDLPVSERIRRLKGLLPDIATDERGALTQLAQDTDAIVAAIAAYHSARRGWMQLTEKLPALSQQPDRPTLIRELARLFDLRREPSFGR
jgi:hypothetical protein